MLRGLLLLLPLIAGIPLAAQPEPDTTAPARYFPLAVGDVWEYEGAGFFEGYQRRAVVGDTVVGGQTYARYQVTYFGPTGAPPDSTTEVHLRVDPVAHAIRTPDGNPEAVVARHLTTCDLGAPFFAELFDCPGSAVVLTSGGPETVYIGEDSVATTVKFFDDNSREVVGTYAADVGFLGFTMRTGQMTLVYASVGGITLGTPIPVASAPAPAPISSLHLMVQPNPTKGAVSLRVEMPPDGSLTLETFDVLGRRMWRSQARHPAGAAVVDVDTEGWSAGTYVVRATAAGAVATSMLIRR